MITPNTLILLYYPKEKLSYFIKLKPDEIFSTHKGMIKHNDILNITYGEFILSHQEEIFYVFRPSLSDILMNLKRHTQIIYPKDIGYILLKLGIRPGDIVLEAGTGSGALTIALGYGVFPSGHVYTYDYRPEFSQKAYKNIEMAGIEDMVTPDTALIGEEPFKQNNADAVFLDMKDPSLAIHKAFEALKFGGNLGILVPTTNQVSDCIRIIETLNFSHTQVCEIFLREYKLNADRLRPNDRMVAHTGFLIFTKKSFCISTPMEANNE